MKCKMLTLLHASVRLACILRIIVDYVEYILYHLFMLRILQHFRDRHSVITRWTKLFILLDQIRSKHWGRGNIIRIVNLIIHNAILRKKSCMHPDYKQYGYYCLQSLLWKVIGYTVALKIKNNTFVTNLWAGTDIQIPAKYLSVRKTCLWSRKQKFPLHSLKIFRERSVPLLNAAGWKNNSSHVGTYLYIYTPSWILI